MLDCNKKSLHAGKNLFADIIVFNGDTSLCQL